jgi:hypothetical protein
VDDERLKKILSAARDQEEGKNPLYNSEDAERAEDLGYIEVEGGGRISLTEKGRDKLGSFQ